MRYKKFVIKGYRGISDITEINLTKESLIPIIGKNESGKTTCLEAINCFDYNNDKDNQGKHLSNIDNLYSTIETPIVIAAEINVDKDFDLIKFFKPYLEETKTEFEVRYPDNKFDPLEIDVEKENLVNSSALNAYQKLCSIVNNYKAIVIDRNLRDLKYSLPQISDVVSLDFQDELGKFLVNALPYILYFDDFRDRLPEKLFISEDSDQPQFSIWITYIDELFHQTRSEYSVYDVPSKKDSIRRSIIREVEKKLNLMLTQEWSKYQFENKEDIQIKIEFVETSEEPYLTFKIVETVFIDGNQEERYFDISDRSKGFFWYFNFMIKLHFNPSKRHDNDNDTIYLLDEPGSYLHTYALNKLAEQLKRLSEKNKVIYCTHFHNLLNPEFVPINSIRIAEKVNNGKINLKRVDDKELIRPQRNSAYQPILDALEVKPPLIEYDYDNVILLEGIYDFYSFKMFTSDTFNYFPCVSATSIINQIPYMIFLKKNYLAVWDDDSVGRAMLEKAKELFGEVEAKRFLTLQAIGGNRDTKLEEYYDLEENKKFITEHMAMPDLSFYKMIIQLFYSSERAELIERYFTKTRANFLQMDKSFEHHLNTGLPSL